MKVDLIRLKNRSKLRFRHTFREKFGVLGLKMVEIGQKSLFLVISDCFLAVSDRKSHKISFSLAKMDSRAHFKIEIRVLRFVSENRFLVIWGLLESLSLTKIGSIKCSGVRGYLGRGELTSLPGHILVFGIWGREGRMTFGSDFNKKMRKNFKR